MTGCALSNYIICHILDFYLFFVKRGGEKAKSLVKVFLASKQNKKTFQIRHSYFYKCFINYSQDYNNTEFIYILTLYDAKFIIIMLRQKIKEK